MGDAVGTQIILEFARREPVATELLADAAESCLAALHAKAQFLAFGPAVSADFERSAIEVECTVAAEDQADIARSVERISEIVRAAIAEHEYTSSSRLESVPA